MARASPGRSNGSAFGSSADQFWYGRAGTAHGLEYSSTRRCSHLLYREEEFPTFYLAIGNGSTAPVFEYRKRLLFRFLHL
jgi:hypothetical protein